MADAAQQGYRPAHSLYYKATLRYTEGRLMAASPVEVTLELTPRSRFDIIDVRTRLRTAHGDCSTHYPRHLYHSFHTTAGYLEQSLAARLTRERETVAPYVEVFRAMFPGRGGLRARPARSTQGPDLGGARGRTAQRRFAPRVHGRRPEHLRDATSTGRRSRCAFVDLDGVTDGRPRRRLTSIVGFIARA